MNHHFQRWITGIIAVPFLVVFILYSSENIFSLLLLAVIELAVWEYNRLVFAEGHYAIEEGEVFVFAAAIVTASYLGDFTLVASALTFCLLATFFIFILRIEGPVVDISRIGKVILGFMYMPLLMSAFISLRLLPQGVRWVMFSLILAFCGDIFGFYVGRTIGKRKLHPLISPGKTVEGTLGMIVGSALGGIAFREFFFTELPFIHALSLGVFGGILGQLGDLFESAVKRSAGVKDAGYIFPGHGGILDRLDSLSFIAPAVFYYQHFFIK
jgi:phosphatidate cytidylyltransferase